MLKWSSLFGPAVPAGDDRSGWRRVGERTRRQMAMGFRPFRLHIITFVALCLAGCGNSPTGTKPAPEPVKISGTWTGSFTSTTAGCGTSTITVTFSQSGKNFTSTYSLSGGPVYGSGTINGTIDSSGRMSGTWSAALGSCSAVGPFTGTATSTTINLSVPTLTPSGSCRACQNNTIHLSR